MVILFLSDPGGHLIAMGVFGYAGYWAYRWDIKAGDLLKQKREEILARRQVGRVVEWKTAGVLVLSAVDARAHVWVAEYCLWDTRDVYVR